MALGCLAGGLGVAAPRAFTLADPFSPFFAQAPGEVALLLFRVLLLLGLVIATDEYKSRPRALWLGSVATLFLASLCCRILLWPYAIVALLGIGNALGRVSEASKPPTRRTAWLLLIGACIAPWLPRASRAVVPEPVEPARAVAYWTHRKNPYQAHYRALQWAKREVVPGEGYLALAEIDIAMQRLDKARKVLDKIVTRTDSEVSRRRAEARLKSLDPAKPSKATP